MALAAGEAKLTLGTAAMLDVISGRRTGDPYTANPPTRPFADEVGVDIAVELENHNSTMALIKLKSAIYTGNTGMALGDLRVAIVR